MQRNCNIDAETVEIKKNKILNYTNRQCIYYLLLITIYGMTAIMRAMSASIRN